MDSRDTGTDLDCAAAMESAENHIQQAGLHPASRLADYLNVLRGQPFAGLSNALATALAKLAVSARAWPRAL